MYDRLTAWWIMNYIMLRCYSWNQDIVFFEKKNYPCRNY